MKSTVRRFYLSIVVVISVLFFTGCIDIVHYIGCSGQDTVINLRITIQKMIFRMMAQMGGEELFDEDFEEDFGLAEEEVCDRFPEGLSVGFTQIDNDTDFGFNIMMRLDDAAMSTILEEEPDTPFVPLETDGGYRIVLPLMGPGMDDTADNELATAFFASTKYRLLLSRTLLPEIVNVTLRIGGKNFSPAVTELPEIYLVEFPMVLWAAAADAAVIEIELHKSASN